MANRVFDFQKPSSVASPASSTAFTLSNDRSIRQPSNVQRPAFQLDFNFSTPAKDISNKPAHDSGMAAKPISSASSIITQKSNNLNSAQSSIFKSQTGPGVESSPISILIASKSLRMTRSVETKI